MKVITINRCKVRDNMINAAIIAAIISINEPNIALAYTKGEILTKSQPIITLLKDFAEPLAYGCYIWAFIRYILGQRPEAIQMFKSTTWGFVGIQVLPWIFSIIKSVGD